MIRWGGPPSQSDRFERTDLLPTSAARDLEVADLDEDGFPDIVFANHHDESGSLDVDSVVYWGSATGFDAGNATFLPTHGATDVLVADVDGDGREDIVDLPHLPKATLRDKSPSVKGIDVPRYQALEVEFKLVPLFFNGGARFAALQLLPQLTSIQRII